MGWLALSAFDPTPTADCLGGQGPFIKLMIYDSRIIAMLFIILVATPMNAVIVYHYAVDLPPHPKFLLLLRYKIATRLHTVSGSIEIIAGLVMLFVIHPVPWVRVQAVASIVHAVSAMALIPLLFGMKLFMNIVYGTGVIMKALLAINVLVHPDCYDRALALVAFHTVYAWVRVIFVFLREVKIMKDCRYTAAVLLASVVVLPVVDRLANAINISLICIGGLYLTWCADEQTRVNNLTEFSRDVTTFKHYYGALKKCKRSARVTMARTAMIMPKAAGILDREKTVDLEGDETLDQDPQVRAWAIFEMITKGSKKKLISCSQLAAVLCSFGMPETDAAEVMKKYSSGGQTITFDTFFSQLQPLWEYMFVELSREEEIEDDNAENMMVSLNTDYKRLSEAYKGEIGEIDQGCESEGEFAPNVVAGESKRSEPPLIT